MSVRSATNSRMKLFLSHSSIDAGLVDLVKTRLTPLGITVYAAEFDNKAGANVHDKVLSEIRLCDLMVVLLTGAGYSSIYVQQEIGVARENKKMVIPIVVPEIAKEDLGLLTGTEYIIYNEIEPESALLLLSQRIEEISRQHVQIQKQREDFVFAVGLGLILGVILSALSE